MKKYGYRNLSLVKFFKLCFSKIALKFYFFIYLFTFGVTVYDFLLNIFTQSFHSTCLKSESVPGCHTHVPSHCPL